MVMLPSKNLFTTTLALCLCLFSTFSQATLSSRVDRHLIAINESFTLLISSDERLDEEPKLSILKKDFKIINQQKSNSLQMINGKTTRSIQWQLTLLARRTGPLTIPAIHAGSQKTLPISLLVSQSKAQVDDLGNEDIFIQTEVDINNVYVQQQIIYTIKIFHALDNGINIASGSALSEISFSQGDAVIQPLGEDKQYQGLFNKRPYGVIERRYSLYPQTSGQLEIEPLRFDARIIKQQRTRRVSPFANLQQNIQLKQLQSKAISIVVKPVPKAFQGKYWLPTKKLRLHETWSSDITQIKVGEPITRTLSITTENLSAAQIPELEYTISSNIKQYPDQAVLDDQISHKGINGSRQQKLALIANKAGEITLPAIEILWWNTATDQQEIARISAQTLKILAADPISAPALLPVSHASTIDKVQIQDQFTDFLFSHAWWPWLTLCFALLWLISLFKGSVLLKKRKRNKKIPQKAPKNTSSLLKAIKQSCKTNDAQKSHDALIAWAREQCPDENIDSLGRLASYCEVDLADAIRDLESHLYAKNTASWQGALLWQNFKHATLSFAKKDKPKKGSLKKVLRPFT